MTTSEPGRSAASDRFAVGQPAPSREPAGRSDRPCIVGRRLSRAGGVAIIGPDLAKPLPYEVQALILDAFRRHHIVVFPGQQLSREQQFAFTAQFGEVEQSVGRRPGSKRYGVAHVIANLDADGNPVRRVSAVSNYNWHTDKAYHPVPPLLTTLYGVELPRRGGDTEFANTAMGYAALPDETKRQIDGLRVVFRWGAGLARTGERPPDIDPAAGGPGRLAPVDHPLVRTHPDTGDKALYLGNHSSHILGMAEAEGTALLDALLAHTTERRFVYSHAWRKGDLVMWDNRCLLHRAVANFDMGGERRVLHRTVVRGTVPI
jgi:alpha-ketoglutarate-dependent taurine dioxygenase